MARLGGKLRLNLSPPDALVACVDAIDRMGWHVDSVESHRVVSKVEYSDRSLSIEVRLRESAQGGTLLRVIGTGSESDRESIRSAMFELREAVGGSAKNAAQPSVGSGSPTGEQELELEPEFRERLAQVTAKDRRSARVFRIIALALVVMSVVLFAEAGVTLLWQEPLSYAYAKRQQAELDDELQAIEAQYRRVETPPIRRRPPSFPELASRLAKSSAAGEPLGRMRIPSVDLETVIVEDASAASLQKGPAHYAGTPLPGQPGTVGIAGHRTTYQAPFHDLDDLERGDRVVVRMPYGVFRYRVEGSKVVPPDDVQVLNRVGHDRLTLTACHPLYSASERIVVFARLSAKQRASLAAPKP